MSLEQGSTGRLLLQIAQTAGTIAATYYGGPPAGLLAGVTHTAVCVLEDAADDPAQTTTPVRVVEG